MYYAYKNKSYIKLLKPNFFESTSNWLIFKKIKIRFCLDISKLSPDFYLILLSGVLKDNSFKKILFKAIEKKLLTKMYFQSTIYTNKKTKQEN